MVNYYLVYGTSETLDPARSCEGPVNYYLDYGTSETVILLLLCGTSETFHVMLTTPER